MVLVDKSAKEMSNAELIVYLTHGKQLNFCSGANWQRDRFSLEEHAWMDNRSKWTKEIEAELKRRGIDYNL